MDENKKNKINVDSISRIQEELNSKRGESILHEERHELKNNSYGVSNRWERKQEKPVHFVAEKEPKSFLKRALIWSITFFVLAAGLATLVILLGFNLTSAENVEIEVSGLTAIDGGTELSLDVAIVNKNRVAITDAEITLAYPEGSRKPENILEPLIREKQIIPEIGRKSSASRIFKSILYGERQSVKSIKISLEYKTQGSDAILKVEKDYEVSIRSAPVVITAIIPKEASVGQSTRISLEIASNSTQPLKNLLLTASYPAGFTPGDLSPAATFDKKVWVLGDLDPREKKEIVIEGKLDGQENEEKVFKFAVGTESPKDNRLIGVEFVSNYESIFLREPFVSLVIEIENTKSGDFVARMGDKISVRIPWVNNLDSDLRDVTLEAKITGKPINKNSVDPEQDGFYRSQSDTITWDKNTSSILNKLTPSESGHFDFSFDTLKPAQSSFGMFKNSEINIALVMKGTRDFESESSEKVSIEAERKIKIETDLSLSSRIVHSIGPIRNSGPIPPKAERPTTYTIIWALSSSFNDVENPTVTAILPVYAEYTGNISPANSEITFNSETRTVTWNAGRILAGTGFGSPQREVAFQISFTPSQNQVGSGPILLGETEVTGLDTFTRTQVSDKNPALSTRISTDPIYSFGKEKVE